MRFSQRYGFRPIKGVIQRDSMDDDLRVSLWNTLDIVVFSRAAAGNFALEYEPPEIRGLARTLWHSFFKWPLDSMAPTWDGIEPVLRDHFFKCAWDEVYDFIEFVAGQRAWADDFQVVANRILERELSAWRLVGGRIIEVTSPAEMGEVENALAASPQPVSTHLQSALALLSDRKNPDYRNSIKESISAVEALVNTIAGSKGTLGAALKKLGVDAHPALQAAFTKLYGYTSDAQGIRHALMDEPNLESEDARFMLVSCSAFVNYLREKARRAGVKF